MDHENCVNFKALLITLCVVSVNTLFDFALVLGNCKKTFLCPEIPSEVKRIKQATFTYLFLLMWIVCVFMYSARSGRDLLKYLVSV